ncbi:MAG: hypothetical protein D6679_13730 [Candidatus Hydrogenedentota bacterium]|nr:MAG: hypothetical protein D6679_13730 [Candidatus Hydrogenedentota bacterium]
MPQKVPIFRHASKPGNEEELAFDFFTGRFYSSLMLRRCVHLVILLSIFSFLGTSCASTPAASKKPTPWKSYKTFAVFPPEQDWPRSSDPRVEESRLRDAELLFRTLSREIDVRSPGTVIPQSRVPNIGRDSERSKGNTSTPYIAAARNLGADAAVATRIFLLETGLSESYLGSRAQLGFELTVFDVSSGRVVWKSRYYETQPSFAEGKTMQGVFSSLGRIAKPYEFDELVDIGVRTVLDTSSP